MTKYNCEYCETASSSISTLVASPFHRYPLGINKGKHRLYEKSEKSKYDSKYYGTSLFSLQSLTASPCYRHPNGANKV